VQARGAGREDAYQPSAQCRGARGARQRLRWRRLQPEEVGAVAQAFDELIADAERAERSWVEQARVVFLVVYGLGLRRGEVLGLRWRSVRLADPEAKPTLTVEAATVRGRNGARPRRCPEVSDEPPDARAGRVPCR